MSQGLIAACLQDLIAVCLMASKQQFSRLTTTTRERAREREKERERKREREKVRKIEREREVREGQEYLERTVEEASSEDGDGGGTGQLGYLLLAAALRKIIAGNY
jgi:uncharacterized protein YaiL (DUF2058 family)